VDLWTNPKPQNCNQWLAFVEKPPKEAKKWNYLVLREEKDKIKLRDGKEREMPAHGQPLSAMLNS
jgi:hypothetical protein